MKLIIAGSRTFTDYPLLCQVLAPDRRRITQVITGGERGAELLAYRWAWKHAITHQLFRADWERFGKSAGVHRNHLMAQAGDLLVAFWDGRSAVTRHTISCKQHLPVRPNLEVNPRLR
jgi:protein gp37